MSLRRAGAIFALVSIGLALPNAGLAAIQTVTIQDFSYAPQAVTVDVGESVTWRNAGGESHTATSNNPGFDTGVLNPGSSKSIVFGTAGTFDYHCAIHPSMRGTVTVLVAAPPTSAPPTVAPTTPPTNSPTAVPTAAPPSPPTAAPTTANTNAAPTTAPSASATATPSPITAATTAAATVPPVATPSPNAPTLVPTAAPAPSGGVSPLPAIFGAAVLVGIVTLAAWGFRRR